MNLLILAILLSSSVNANGNVTLNETIKHQLYTVLDFIEQKYEEIHFDGLFGVTFAHAFLLKSSELSSQWNSKLDLSYLINKCTNIYEKIYPLLPNNPEYMIQFRERLLNATKWKDMLPNRFTVGKIKYLGYYKDWTADTIIQNKKASYRGVKTDFCLREIVELSRPNEVCYVSNICEEMMLDNSRVDAGYLLTHRLLYMQIIKLHSCKLPRKHQNVTAFITNYCSYIYKELVTSERLNYPHHDIFLEQIALCGMEGYAEFLNPRWLNAVMHWQNPHGCYESIGETISKRTSFPVDFGCSDHTTGLGAAVLALHLRFQLNDFLIFM